MGVSIEGATVRIADAPLVVGIGGTTVPGSSTEPALTMGVRGAEAAGMRTSMCDGVYLSRLPLYTPKMQNRLQP